MNNMKKKNNKIKYFVLFILMLISSFTMNLTNSRYTSQTSMDNTLEIAKPVLEMVSDSANTLENMYPGQEVEYYFSVKNTDGNVNNEVVLNYYIEVAYKNTNLPLTYTVYQIADDGTETQLATTSNKTDKILIGFGNIETHKYKIKFTWPISENSITYQNKQLEVDVNVFAEQKI